MKCKPWRQVHKPSGRQAHVRVCGRNKIEIVSGDGSYHTANIWVNGLWVDRSSGTTLTKTKAKADRIMRRFAR